LVPWSATVSRNDKIASREFGGGGGIAGAWKRVGEHARSVESRCREKVAKKSPRVCAASLSLGAILVKNPSTIWKNYIKQIVKNRYRTS